LLKPTIPPITIVKASRGAPLTKGQKTFNALIKQIEQGRTRLAAQRTSNWCTRWIRRSIWASSPSPNAAR
jgi:hypothetical protein